MRQQLTTAEYKRLQLAESSKAESARSGTLTVNDNGKATDIVQNSGAALQTSTANGIEISGTHQYNCSHHFRQFLATNMCWKMAVIYW